MIYAGNNLQSQAVLCVFSGESSVTFRLIEQNIILIITLVNVIKMYLCAHLKILLGGWVALASPLRTAPTQLVTGNTQLIVTI